MSDDGPINTKLSSFEVHHAGAERTLKEVARTLKAAMPPDYGFALFIFEYGADEANLGSMFYCSSAERDSVLKILKEFIDRQEQQQ